MTKIIIRKKKQDAEEQEGQQGQQCNADAVITPSLLKLKSKSTLKLSKPLKQLPEEISINNYALLLCNDYDYKVIDLKKMCTKIQRDYEYKKMKTTGTKVEMKQNIYNFYNQTFHSIKIQLKFNSHLRRKMIMLRGPALKNREMCINETDFYTLDPIRDIPDAQSYSYE